MGEIARSKSRIASDLKTRDSNRWRPCDSKLRFETRDWRFFLNIPIQQNCEKGCDLSPRSKIASDWRLAILPIYRGNPKYHPFWGSPLFYKAPPRQFRPPKCKLAPSKLQIDTLQKGIGDLQSAVFCIEIHRNLPSAICILEGVNLHFGG